MREKFFFVITVLLIVVDSTGYAAGLAKDARQEYACGSLGAIPAMIAESASLRCADGSGRQTDITAGGKNVLCLYATECTPATTRVKRKVLEFLRKDDWSKLTDDEIARAVVMLDRTPSMGALERTGMQVHCVASRTRNGNPDCPGVNECANDQTSTLIWRVSPLELKYNPGAVDVNGLRIEKSESSAPERLEPRTEGTRR